MNQIVRQECTDCMNQQARKPNSNCHCCSWKQKLKGLQFWKKKGTKAPPLGIVENTYARSTRSSISNYNSNSEFFKFIDHINAKGNFHYLKFIFF